MKAFINVQSQSQYSSSFLRKKNKNDTSNLHLPIRLHYLLVQAAETVSFY